MKSLVLAVLISAQAAAALGADSGTPAIIPKPEKMELVAGAFKLTRQTKIIADTALREEGRLLAEQLRRSTGYKFPVSVKAQASSAKDAIVLTTQGAKGDLGAEGYELDVTAGGVVIRAPAAAGIFYGTQTLLQLLPPQVLAAKAAPGVAWTVPCVHIEDAPRFKWRGMMLDVARHFFTKAEVEHTLDAMALHKLNTFHWHLTDDQGWRIEIKKYPLLTKVGAWRKSIGFNLDPKASHAYGADGRYGGFYTQDDIREVVAYARARHITIVPEIEMPGHACAALMAYPQYSCTGGPFTTDLPGGVFNGIYCAGNDDAFAFVDDILGEVIELFPSKYIHIGGDEVLPDNWKNCPKCQARMRQEGLHEEKELEAYFIRRIEKYINSRGRNLIGWSEIREGGLAQNAAVMDWIGGAVEAASAGHDTVMSPLLDCYFDHYQSTNLAAEPHAIGGYLPLSQVYAFEPMPAKLEARFQSHILGAQANVWTEYMPSIQHVQYMMFPRACALSEVVWSPRESHDWNDFTHRLETDCRRLDQMGINYRHEPASKREPASSR
jgi:hexosaminidase